MKPSKYRVGKPGKGAIAVIALAVALNVAAFAFHRPEAEKMSLAVLGIVSAALTISPVKEREP